MRAYYSLAQEEKIRLRARVQPGDLKNGNCWVAVLPLWEPLEIGVVRVWEDSRKIAWVILREQDIAIHEAYTAYPAKPIHYSQLVILEPGEYPA